MSVGLKQLMWTGISLCVAHRQGDVRFSHKCHIMSMCMSASTTRSILKAVGELLEVVFLQHDSESLLLSALWHSTRRIVAFNLFFIFLFYFSFHCFLCVFVTNRFILSHSGAFCCLLPEDVKQFSLCSNSC